MIEEIISSQRLGRYLRAAGHDTNKAMKLYGWNMQLSEAFFPSLSAAEVCLRNKISKRLRELHGEDWWCKSELLDQLGKAKGQMKWAQKKLRKKGDVTEGGIIAELTFGFWAKMLLPKYEQILWTEFRSTFEQLPDNINYAQFFERCDAIREFRNRIFHHEPIFDYDLSLREKEILELITWISPEKAKWVKPYSRVQVILRQRPR